MNISSQYGLLVVADGTATARLAVMQALSGMFVRTEECASGRALLEKAAGVAADLVVMGTGFHDCRAEIVLRHLESMHGRDVLSRIVVLGDRRMLPERHAENLLGVFPLPLEKYLFREYIKTVLASVESVNQKLNVLLVEDCAVNRTLTGMMLKDMGHLCSCAGSGASAKNLFFQSNFDLVLMDIELPDTDGYRLARWIRDHRRCSGTLPIVAFSAHKKTECPEAAFFNDWLEKPAGRTELQRVLSLVSHPE